MNFFKEMNTQGNGMIRSFLRQLAYLLVVGLSFALVAGFFIAVDRITGRTGSLSMHEKNMLSNDRAVILAIVGDTGVDA